MPNNRTRRNHYNPITYQKGFTYKDKLYRYDVDSSQYLYTSGLVNLGVETDLYSQEFEEFLAQNVDRQYAPVIRKIIQHIRSPGKYPPLSSQEISSLISFTAFQMLRIPSFREEHTRNLETYRAQLPYANDPALQGVLDSLYSPQESFESTAMAVYPEIFRMVREKRWMIGVAPKGKTFITSDTCMGMVTSSLSPGQEGLGFGTEKTLIFVVLDKKRCLILMNGENNMMRGIPIDDISETMFDLINGAVMLGAKRYIYASSKRSIMNSLKQADHIKEYTAANTPPVEE